MKTVVADALLVQSSLNVVRVCVRVHCRHRHRHRVTHLGGVDHALAQQTIVEQLSAQLAVRPCVAANQTKNNYFNLIKNKIEINKNTGGAYLPVMWPVTFSSNTRSRELPSHTSIHIKKNTNRDFEYLELSAELKS
jgi:hypothetical protein